MWCDWNSNEHDLDVIDNPEDVTVTPTKSGPGLPWKIRGSEFDLDSMKNRRKNVIWLNFAQEVAYRRET